MATVALKPHFLILGGEDRQGFQIRVKFLPHSKGNHF